MLNFYACKAFWFAATSLTVVFSVHVICYRQKLIPERIQRLSTCFSYCSRHHTLVFITFWCDCRLRKVTLESGKHFFLFLIKTQCFWLKGSRFFFATDRLIVATMRCSGMNQIQKISCNLKVTFCILLQTKNDA